MNVEVDDSRGFLVWIDNEDGTVTFIGKDPRISDESVTAIIPKSFSEMMDIMQLFGRDEAVEEAVGEIIFVPNEPESS